MNPLTQEELAQVNDYIATLGPDKREEKDEILQKLRAGDAEFLPYIRNLIAH